MAFWDSQLEWWVGKPIGYGKPRYKRHLKELKRSEKPLSTWFVPAATKKAELEELDVEGIETLSVGYTSEGTTLLKQMVGNKDFPYPKPLSLVQGLVKQATSGDDIVLDFFAGSGTTAHAVLAQNALDDANRSFILVSSTEATQEEPAKNICRDITQKRLRAAIEGYSFTQKKKDKNEQKQVAGLEGNFLYARTRRIPTEKAARRLNHPQIWLALQLMGGIGARPFDGQSPCQWVAREEGSLLYLPDLGEGSGEFLQSLWPRLPHPLAIYAWNLEAVRALLLARDFDLSGVGFHPIPQAILERFGLRNGA